MNWVVFADSILDVLVRLVRECREDEANFTMQPGGLLCTVVRGI